MPFHYQPFRRPSNLTSWSVEAGVAGDGTALCQHIENSAITSVVCKRGIARSTNVCYLLTEWSHFMEVCVKDLTVQ